MLQITPQPPAPGTQNPPQTDFVVPVREADGKMVLTDIGGNGGKTPAQATGGTNALRVNQVLELVRPMGLSGVQTARLRNMVAAYVAGERELQETREMVERPETAAGVGLASDDAAWLMDAMQAVRFNRPTPERRKGRLPVGDGMPAASATHTAPVVEKPTVPKKKPVTPVPPTDFSGMKRQDVFSTLAKDMVDDLKPTLPNTEFRPRLEALIVTRLRGVRDKTELLAHLLRGVPEGGMGLPAAEANRLADAIEVHVSKLQTELSAVKKQDILTSLNKAERKEEAHREQTGGALADYAQSVWLEGKLSGRAPANQPAPSPATAAPVAPRGLMQDVVPAPTKLLGPMEELAAMTLVDFRRLAKEPAEAIKRIQGKIELLKEEDYRQQALAITAWQQSEPFRLYVALTRQMLEMGQAPEAVLAGENPDKTPRLTLEEYNAIMKLQQSLRV